MSAAYPWASPAAVSGMTLPQLWMYLPGVDTDGAPSNAFQSTAERNAYADAVRTRKGQE